MFILISNKPTKPVPKHKEIDKRIKGPNGVKRLCR